MTSADAVPPRKWVLGLWALCRGFWVIALPSAFCISFLFSAVYSARNGYFAACLTAGAIALLILAIIWRAAADIRNVLIGEKPSSEKFMLSEIGTMTAFFAIFIVISAITAPTYRGLLRRSADGAMKNNLNSLRAAVGRYRAAHDGRAPDSLEAMVAAKDLPALPLLWPFGSESTHAKTSGTIIVHTAAAADTGQWAYVVSLSSPGDTGAVFIDCTHTDTKGSAWTIY